MRQVGARAPLTPAARPDEADRVQLVRYRDTRDVIPRRECLPIGNLAGLLAPERPPVRAGLAAELRRRLATIDRAARCLRGEEPTPDWLRDYPMFRALERAVHVATDDPAAALEAAEARARSSATSWVKGRLAGWGPVICRDHATRSNQAVIAITCLVLDYEDGTSLDAAVAPWLHAPVMAHSTWRHQADAPRLRVVVPFAEPVPAERWGPAWRWLVQRAAGQPDTACKDPARGYALPAIPHVAAPYQRHASGLHLPGLALPPEALVSEVRPRELRPTLDVFRGGRTASPRRAEAIRRLATDASVRARAAEHLGARIGDRWARNIPCPRCGEPSVWFWLEPGRMSSAACAHKNSCGWRGPLHELLDEAGRSHDR